MISLRLVCTTILSNQKLVQLKSLHIELNESQGIRPMISFTVLLWFENL